MRSDAEPSQFDIPRRSPDSGAASFRLAATAEGTEKTLGQSIPLVNAPILFTLLHTEAWVGPPTRARLVDVLSWNLSFLHRLEGRHFVPLRPT
jgi:hypothetical protein